MFYCDNCGHYFIKSLVIEESYGLPGPWRQRFDGCPFCRTTGMIGVVNDAAE